MSAEAAAAELPSRESAFGFDLRSLPSGFFDDPFPWYHALRRYDPVHLSPDGSYLLTRYADCAAVYRDARCISDKQRLFRPKFGDSPLYQHHTTSLVFSDPPYHTRVRHLITGALKPQAVKSIVPSLESLVDGLLDEIEEQGSFDVIVDFAVAIPIEIIGNLLRVPRDERAPMRGWSRAILGALEPTLTPEQLDAGNTAVVEFCDYLRTLVADRRKNLSADESDILSQLIRGENGERLSEEELLQNCIFLLNAGHETTTNLIGNGVHSLLTHPEELARLRAEPGLIKTAIEEILRYQSPNQLGNREVAEDLSCGGIDMAAGTQVSMCIGAANRDPEQFPEPDRFDIGRTPNSHLAFASGRHICAGMSVARLEGKIAIARIVERFPELRLTGDAVRSRRARFRGFESIPAAIH